MVITSEISKKLLNRLAGEFKDWKKDPLESPQPPTVEIYDNSDNLVGSFYSWFLSGKFGDVTGSYQALCTYNSNGDAPGPMIKFSEIRRIVLGTDYVFEKEQDHFKAGELIYIEDKMIDNMA